MNLKFIDAHNFHDLDSIKKEISKSCMSAWIWDTHAEHEFRISVLSSFGLLHSDKSFLVYLDECLVGFVPLVFTLNKVVGGVEASYDRPLPWPSIVDKHHDQIISLILDEIEARCFESAANKISLQLSSLWNPYEPPHQIYNLMRARRFVDDSYESHCIELSDKTNFLVRDRYKKYINKSIKNYEIKIHHTVDYPLIHQYMDLHVKDAGKQFRPLQTYEKQLNIVNKTNSFLIETVDKVHGNTVGMLLIYVDKHAAYDASVAVDPLYENHFVSHIMKHVAINQLNEMHIKFYELGPVYRMSTFLIQPEEKKIGINFFKDGWSRGVFKKNYVFVKFYDDKYLDTYWESRLNSLKNTLKVSKTIS